MAKASDGRRGRGRPSAGAREALVAAAHELFLGHDYDDVSTAQILDRSGVSRGALYHHFPSKLDLFRAVYEASERRLVEQIAGEALTATTPFGGLLAASRAYLRRCETDEAFIRINLIQSRAVLGWERWRAVATDLGIGLALAAVTAAIEAGELPPLEPETLAIVLLGALIEAAMLIATTPADDRLAARERSEAVIVDLLEGLRR
ncbi:MAG TPA: TetR/AcrR family transcriptional regulator [Solirubrobacterales bacterium]|nr:TetR/AcrR family transcriptional regulator [Solirubrobacterales bacterium]